MDTISHIWFDFAGTLYQETPEFSKLHDEFRFKTYATLQGVDDIDRAEREFLKLYKKYGSNSAVFKSLGQPADYWMDALEAIDLTSVLRPDREVISTLHTLVKSVPLSLFTNFKRQQIDKLLKYLQIPDTLFTHILSGDDVLERKPALSGFYTIIESSQLDPKQILYVGDRVDVDIKPAHTVGLQTALVYSQNPVADFCFDSFSQLTSIL